CNSSYPATPRPFCSELSHEADFRLQVVSQPLPNGALCQVDQLPHFPCGTPAVVDDDVGVLVEDPHVAQHVALEPAFVDQPARPYPLDLLEDRPGARVQPEIRMPFVPPLQVLADRLA